MRPYTTDRPKPMVSINDRPLLYYHLSWLKSGGVRNAYILCGYKHEVIENHFGSGESIGVRIHYVVEDEPLGRGGAIKKGLSMLDPNVDIVVATNGDTITDQPLPELVNAHRLHKGMATLMLSPLVSPYGVVDTDGDRVVKFLEKPSLPYWVNSGVYVLSREIERYLPDKGDHETTTFPELAKQGRLFCVKSKALWMPVDTVKDLNEASKLVDGILARQS